MFGVLAAALGDAAVAQAGRDRRQVRPAARRRPGAGLPARVHARAALSRRLPPARARASCRSWRWVYDEPQLLAPGLVCSLAIVGAALQTPIWPYYRSMDFLRQRTLQAVDPLVAFVVTVGLAVAGAGYWALVIGLVAGSVRRRGRSPSRSRRIRCACAGSAARCAPTSFSWPLLVAAAAGIVDRAVGDARRRADARAGGCRRGRAGLVDRRLHRPRGPDRHETLYPAICAVARPPRGARRGVREVQPPRAELGLPFGIGPRAVRRAADRRTPSATAGCRRSGSSRLRADRRGRPARLQLDRVLPGARRTRPIAVVNGAMAVVFLAVAIPLLLSDGLDGPRVGMAITTASRLAAAAFSSTGCSRGAARCARRVPAAIPTALGRSPRSSASPSPVALRRGRRGRDLAAAGLAAARGDRLRRAPARATRSCPRRLRTSAATSRARGPRTRRGRARRATGPRARAGRAPSPGDDRPRVAPLPPAGAPAGERCSWLLACPCRRPRRSTARSVVSARGRRPLGA